MADLGGIFGLQAGVAEMMLRGSAIYWAVLICVRVSGRREIGPMGLADLMVLLLVADAAGNAMSGNSDSVGDGIIVVATIVGWSVLLDRVAYRIPTLHRLLDPDRICLIRDGRILRSSLRSEQITHGELMEQLRLKGIASLSDVKRAYIESTGEFSVIRTGQDIPPGSSTLEEE